MVYNASLGMYKFIIITFLISFTMHFQYHQFLLLFTYNRNMEWVEKNIFLLSVCAAVFLCAINKAKQ